MKKEVAIKLQSKITKRKETIEFTKEYLNELLKSRLRTRNLLRLLDLYDWNNASLEVKPEWLTSAQIDEYAQKMGVK